MRVIAEIHTDLDKFEERMSAHIARCEESGLYYLGGWIRRELKEQGQYYEASYFGWPPLSPYTGTLAKSSIYYSPKRKRAGGRVKGKKGEYYPRRVSKRHNPFARMVSMPMFRVNKERMEVAIGFLESRKWPESKVWAILRRHTASETIRVSPRMRRMFFALGLPLKRETTTLVRPPRPWVYPVRRKRESEFLGIFKARFNESFQNKQISMMPSKPDFISPQGKTTHRG